MPVAASPPAVGVVDVVAAFGAAGAATAGAGYAAPSPPTARIDAGPTVAPSLLRQTLRRCVPGPPADWPLAAAPKVLSSRRRLRWGWAEAESLPRSLKAALNAARAGRNGACGLPLPWSATAQFPARALSRPSSRLSVSIRRPSLRPFFCPFARSLIRPAAWRTGACLLGASWLDALWAFAPGRPAPLRAPATGFAWATVGDKRSTRRAGETFASGAPPAAAVPWALLLSVGWLMLHLARGG